MKREIKLFWSEGDTDGWWAETSIDGEFFDGSDFISGKNGDGIDLDDYTEDQSDELLADAKKLLGDSTAVYMSLS